MTQMTVTFEWDDELGPRWMNRDNLASLLYSSVATKEDLLSIESVHFNDRVQTELDSLGCKLKKLGKFLGTDKFFGLDPYAQRLLERQYTLMTDYVIILEERIEAWTD